MTDSDLPVASHQPDPDPDAFTPPELLNALHQLIVEAPIPPLDDATWSALLASAITSTREPGQPGEPPTADPAGEPPTADPAGEPPTADPAGEPPTGGLRLTGFERLRSQTLELFPDLITAAEVSNAPETQRRLIAAQERLTTARVTVVVCGEFKRGKSTLLNALLGERSELLPVDTAYATRLVTTVSWAPEERITVLLEADGDGEPERRPITRAQIAEYATESGNPRNTKRALLLEIGTPNPALRSGVRWVDTPGVGGVYEDHTAITSGFLPSADLLLFVSDVTKPLTDSELRFLRGAGTAAKVTEDPDGQLFVLAKIDAVGDYRAELRDLTSKVAAATGRPAESLMIVPVSAQAQLDFLDSGDPADRALGNFAELERVISGALHRRRAALLLGGALSELDLAAQALLRPITAEITALGRDTEAEITDARQVIDQKRQRLRTLGEEAEGWRADLASRVAELGTRLNRRAATGLAEVWDRFETDYLYRPEFLADPDRLLGQLASDAAVVVGAVNELARREAAAILAEVAARSDLDLALPRFAALANPPVPAVPVGQLVEVKQAGAGGKLRAVERTGHDPQWVSETVLNSRTGAFVLGTAGGFLGAFVGTFLLPGLGSAMGTRAGAWLGAAIGTLVGGTRGWPHPPELATAHPAGQPAAADPPVGPAGRAADPAARRAAIRSQLATLRSAQHSHLDQATAELESELSRALTAELESRITQELETINRALERLAAGQRTTEQEARRRLAELTAARAPLDHARVTVGRLLAQVAELIRAVPRDHR